MKNSTSLFLAMAVCFYCATTHAKQTTPDNASADLLPAGLISLGDEESAGYALYVEKISQKLFLYHCNGDNIRLLETFSCSTGENSGDKLIAGDKKTPEGIYFFKRIFNQAQLPSKYGAKAFVLDFPNFLDRKMGKGGSGIWLHGTDKQLLPYDSQGCIALNNRDLLAVGSHIKLFSTPIIIEEKIQYQSMAELKSEKEEVLQFLSHWEQSWEEKNIDQYLQCYAGEFRSMGRDRQGWRTYKQRISTKCKFIDILLLDIRILKHNGAFLVSFLQDYESDRYKKRWA